MTETELPATLPVWKAGEPFSWAYTVLLDGKRVDRCLKADATAGEVTVAVVNGLGIVPEGPVQTETRCGQVEIRLRGERTE